MRIITPQERTALLDLSTDVECDQFVKQFRATPRSQLLEGHMAKQDAFMVKKLREAGAIMLAKMNLSEFAGSGGSVSGASDPEIIKAGSIPNGSSSAGGQTKNPHGLLHGPAGSSGGTGAAVAAAFAQFGLGTIPVVSVSNRQPTELSV